MRDLLAALALLFDLSPATAAVGVAAAGALALSEAASVIEDATLGNITAGAVVAATAAATAATAAAVKAVVEVVAVMAVVDFGAVADFGTAVVLVAVVVVFAFEAALAATDPGARALEEAFDDTGVGLLPDSVDLRFRLTVFFLVVVVVPTVVFVSILTPFLAVALDFPPAPPVDFLLVVFPLDAAELEFPVAAEDAGLGGGAMPNNRSSSRTLSSGASKDPPILDNLRRFD